MLPVVCITNQITTLWKPNATLKPYVDLDTTLWFKSFFAVSIPEVYVEIRTKFVLHTFKQPASTPVCSNSHGGLLKLEWHTPFLEILVNFSFFLSFYFYFCPIWHRSESDTHLEWPATGVKLKKKNSFSQNLTSIAATGVVFGGSMHRQHSSLIHCHPR